MIGMTGISGKLGISDIIIPRWYKSLPGPKKISEVRSGTHRFGLEFIVEKSNAHCSKILNKRVGKGQPISECLLGVIDFQ